VSTVRFFKANRQFPNASSSPISLSHSNEEGNTDSGVPLEWTKRESKVFPPVKNPEIKFFTALQLPLDCCSLLTGSL